MSTGNTGTDITIDEVDYIDGQGTCFRIVGESTEVDEHGHPVAQYERIPLPDLMWWEGGGRGKSRRRITLSERSELDQWRVRAINSHRQATFRVRRKTRQQETDAERVESHIQAFGVAGAYEPSAASGEPSSSQQAGMTNEQMMQFYNSMTPEQLQYYGGYDTQYGGNSSMTLPSQQEMEIMGQVYGETMGNQPSSMASYNPELDDESALAQRFRELYGGRAAK
ncbi:hypothetical protein L198_06904 [Cryptococcus wingfieldii CBS 7118]|uniref:Uncharacterized protein n=1 Tax=Cryptococcus wingfieldii CBS 7118 TaxID=1295528 RepID=A0A1E3IGF8_9TREE|nr:hypothetical protein L198_06904 [Cryptococcus wingfieldii CBS 7118]ODN87680.1 hypothetical protein L198_06904 [Cryptococcus wingfieldii CBS 7118]